LLGPDLAPVLPRVEPERFDDRVTAIGLVALKA
jgi:hypothetical protein